MTVDDKSLKCVMSALRYDKCECYQRRRECTTRVGRGRTRGGIEAATDAISEAVDGTFGPSADANGSTGVQRSGNWVQEWVQDDRTARSQRRPAARYKPLTRGFVEWS